MVSHFLVSDRLNDLHVHLHDRRETSNLGSHLRPMPEPGPVRLGATAGSKTLRLIIGFVSILFDQGVSVLLPMAADLPALLDPSGKDMEHSLSLSDLGPRALKACDREGLI